MWTKEAQGGKRTPFILPSLSKRRIEKKGTLLHSVSPLSKKSTKALLFKDSEVLKKKKKKKKDVPPVEIHGLK